MIKTEVYRNIRSSICMLITTSNRYWNLQSDETDVQITETLWQVVGTGFLIAEDVLLTNRHVLDKLDQVGHDFSAIAFFVLDEVGDVCMATFEIVASQTISHKPNSTPEDGYLANHDIAILSFDRKPGMIDANPLAKFSDRNDIQIGNDIAICGYIHGTVPLGKLNDRTTLRSEPLLLQGHIAGLSPYDNDGRLPLNLIITDITNGGGLSGSPIFLPDGTVIGVHCAGLESSADSRVNISGIGRGIPLTSEIVSTFLRINELGMQQRDKGIFGFSDKTTMTKP